MNNYHSTVDHPKLFAEHVTMVASIGTGNLRGGVSKANPHYRCRISPYH